MEEKETQILLVEDDTHIAKLLGDFLSSKGFVLRWASNGLEAWELFSRSDYDLVLLDVMMPYADGFEVLEKIRKVSSVPVLMMTARVDVEDRVRGLEAGADDYICKPFSFKELEARVRANLRFRQQRSKQSPKSTEAEKAGLYINKAEHYCSYQGREVQLTHMQFEILSLLSSYPKRVYTREQIGDHVSLDGFYESFDRTIDAHIKNLRKALSAAGAEKSMIETVRGVGYRFLAE